MYHNQYQPANATVKYKFRQAHHNEPKDDIDQQQADAPADLEKELSEKLKDDLAELKDDARIEPEKINPLKRTYQDVWPKL